MPARTHFELLVDQKQAELVAALRTVPIHDHMRMVYLRGELAGLDLALQAYREAARTDAEADL